MVILADVSSKILFNNGRINNGSYCHTIVNLIGGQTNDCISVHVCTKGKHEEDLGFYKCKQGNAVLDLLSALVHKYITGVHKKVFGNNL